MYTTVLLSRNSVTEAMAQKARPCSSRGMRYRFSLLVDSNLKKDDPTITHTMNTAKIRPRYCEVVTVMVDSTADSPDAATVAEKRRSD